MSIAEAKAALRREMTARRALAADAAGPAGQATATARLVAALQGQAGRVLSGYMPMRREIDPLAAMAAHQGPLCLPVVAGPGLPLRFRAWAPGAPLLEGAFRAMIPETGDWMTPAVLIVPMLAFDARGYRLGYGGGFYDRTLAGLRRLGPCLAVGFAFAAQEVADVLRDDTDARLDLIVTEAGTIRPGG